MNKTFKVLANKKLQLFFLFYLILLLPILVFFIAENITLQQSLYMLVVNGVLFISLATLSIFINYKIEKTIYFVIFFLTLGPSLIYMGYLLFAKVLLQHNSIISLFETNPEESREFLAHYFSKWLVLGQSLYILLCLFIIWKMKSFERLKVKNHKALFISSLLVLIIIFAFPIFSKQVYYYNFYKIFADYKSNLKFEKLAIAERQLLSYEVVNQEDSVPRTIVVVIGESLTRNHMSLYNYERITSPKLASLKDSLIVYKDVVSPQVHTIPVLRSVSTLADIEHPEYITEKPSLFELFNRAGYETSFITNQPFGGSVETSYDVLFKLADHIYNVSDQKQPDEVILAPLKEILSKKEARNRLIVIHLIGNHMAYEFRYTPPFSVFDHKQDKLVSDNSFRNEEAKTMIDRYDNSVLYNDNLVYSVISLLRDKSNMDSGLIYFSDHGEEIYDSRKFAGHAYEKVSAYMCEVPLLVWMSDLYRNKRTDLVIDKDRPFSTSNFLYSLSDFSGLSYPDYQDSLSIFSNNYKKTERYVGRLTYDEVKKLTD